MAKKKPLEEMNNEELLDEYIERAKKTVRKRIEYRDSLITFLLFPNYLTQELVEKKSRAYERARKKEEKVKVMIC